MLNLKLSLMTSLNRVNVELLNHIFNVIVFVDMFLYYVNLLFYSSDISDSCVLLFMMLSHVELSSINNINV